MKTGRHDRMGVFMKNTKIGIVGPIDLCQAYLHNLQYYYKNLKAAAMCNAPEPPAPSVQRLYPVPKIYTSADSLLEDPKIQIVLNLESSPAQATVTEKALKAGKHVYMHRLLAPDFQSGEALGTLAEQTASVYLGCGPDFILSPSLQICRHAIDTGLIGDITGATACIGDSGCEQWHPHPEERCKDGNGPLWEWGPLLISALAYLIGSVRRVSSIAQIRRPHRLITAECEQFGTLIHLKSYTFVSASLLFDHEIVASVITSCDMCAHSLPGLEIYGTKGTLSVQNPYLGISPVILYSGAGSPHGKELSMEAFEHQHEPTGLALWEMADAIAEGRTPRASWQAALHVLEVLEAIRQSAETGMSVAIRTAYLRGEPMPYPYLIQDHKK